MYRQRSNNHGFEYGEQNMTTNSSSIELSQYKAWGCNDTQHEVGMKAKADWIVSQ